MPQVPPAITSSKRAAIITESNFDKREQTPDIVNVSMITEEVQPAQNINKKIQRDLRQEAASVIDNGYLFPGTKQDSVAQGSDNNFLMPLQISQPMFQKQQTGRDDKK